MSAEHLKACLTQHNSLINITWFYYHKLENPLTSRCKAPRLRARDRSSELRRAAATAGTRARTPHLCPSPESASEQLPPLCSAGSTVFLRTPAHALPQSSPQSGAPTPSRQLQPLVGGLLPRLHLSCTVSRSFPSVLEIHTVSHLKTARMTKKAQGTPSLTLHCAPLSPASRPGSRHFSPAPPTPALGREPDVTL